MHVGIKEPLRLIQKTSAHKKVHKRCHRWLQKKSAEMVNAKCFLKEQYCRWFISFLVPFLPSDNKTGAATLSIDTRYVVVP